MTIHFIGDPHLGRKFEAGVPQHRRGERETKQMAHFAAELEAEADDIVMVGDLFDNPHVPTSVVVSAARIALGAAERHPETRYWFLAGNHDLPRNLGVTGAWTAFRKMVDDRLPNLMTVNQPIVTGHGLALFPWQWDVRADEQVRRCEDVPFEWRNVRAAIGHWDLKLFDGKDDHMAPVAALRAVFGDDVRIVSGHYHVPGPYVVDGVTVECTGSMEPYTHGEDPTGELYVTLTAAEAAQRNDLRDKYVRILLEPGEEMPELDCMGLTHKRVGTAVDEEQDTLCIDEFDWDAILRAAIAEMDPVVQVFVKERVHVPEEQR